MTSKPLTSYQDGLERFSGAIWLPTSAIGGSSFGAQFLGEAGVFSAPVPAASALPGGLASQLRCGKYANGGANTANGLRMNTGSDLQFWLGNAVDLGGLYLSVRFRIENWFADTGRLFVGFSNTNTAQVISDTLSATDAIGLWHDSGHGANVLKLISRNNSGAEVETDIPGFTLAAGEAFQWEMWATKNTTGGGEPGFWRTVLTSINSGLRVYTTANGGTRNNQFFAPQVQISSGADATPSRFAIGIANVVASSL